MEEDDQKELQLLPAPHSIASSSHKSSLPLDSSTRYRSKGGSDHHHQHRRFEGTSTVDLQLSISLRPIAQASSDCVIASPICEYHHHQYRHHHHKNNEDLKAEPTSCSSVESLKWQAAEQIRLAAMEKAYAERVRELTKREMELAQSEFARARHMWERAREEVDKAERMKERATRRIDSTCMEITCQSCRQRFRP